MSIPHICLVQFWAPIKVNGSTFLSTADQICAFNKSLSTQPSLCLPKFIMIDRVGGMGLNFKSFGLYSICKSRDMFFGLSELALDDRLDEIKKGLYEIFERHSLPFVQFWIPFSRSGSLQLLYHAGASLYEHSSSMYHEFEYVSEFCLIESGKALVGRAFASQGSCFCKDVTTLSFKEYPLVPSARKARFTQSFAICLQSKCANNIVCVVEYFLPRNEMAVRDTKTFLNMLLSTMKEQLPGFRMLVEVVKVSPSDELDSFEIGQPLLSVQSLQDGGETTEIDSVCRLSNLQKENNVAAALLVSSCSSDKSESLNCGRTVEVDPLLPHPIGEADTTEIIQLDSHFEQPNLETNSAGNATTNNEMIHSHKKNAIQRIEKDHGITRKILEQHYGMTLEDAAKNLHVSRATLKRICSGYNISRWPHHKTRKVNFHVSQCVSFLGAKPYVDDQQCPALSQEEGKDYLGHTRSPATGVSRDSVMTIKVTYRGDIIKFQLPFSSTKVELLGEVKKRLNISLERFSIKYEDEDDDWILIATDSDLSYGMHSLRLSGQTTMRLLITSEADT
ncbi:hypothetical protein R3W88_029813 [Solanum pinnatisectum]|uniref:Uncharacterized protein n=1 Tax=Solanum pinnatisectum TaxID=50273 RepID=A0AAV9K6V2_9SOLN|nr:hypothetical protein R3W88_029813 [Solanum pinnatisectum]